MSYTCNGMISKSEYIDKLNWSFWRSATNTPVVFKLQWCINTVFTDVCTAYFAKLETNAPSVSQQWWHRQEGDQKSSWQIAITSPTCSLWNFLSPWCVHVCASLLCLSDCLCFCMCAWVSTWMRIYMCAYVCSLFQRFCNLRESQTLGLEQASVLGSV